MAITDQVSCIVPPDRAWLSRPPPQSLPQYHYIVNVVTRLVWMKTENGENKTKFSHEKYQKYSDIQTDQFK